LFPILVYSVRDKNHVEDLWSPSCKV
jgi:hypothetical protein